MDLKCIEKTTGNSKDFCLSGDFSEQTSQLLPKAQQDGCAGGAEVLLPWVVQKSLGQEKNTYMFTASGCLAFQLTVISQGKAHWFAVSVGVFVVHEQKKSI